MSRSFSQVVQQPSGSFTHERSGSRFVIDSSGGAGRISLSRDGLSSAYPIAFEIGSGSHASSDIVRIGAYLFQAPITFLTPRQQWEMAPGYEESSAPDFTPSCHVGRARLSGKTLNRFEPIREEDEAITGDRCHGDTSAHLAFTCETMPGCARRRIQSKRSVTPSNSGSACVPRNYGGTFHNPHENQLKRFRTFGIDV